MRTRWSIRRAGLAAFAAILVTGACSDTLTGPLGNLLLSRDITVEELDRLLGEPVRVEVTLGDHDLIARTVRVKSSDERGGEELLFARITGLVSEGDGGHVVLDLGGLEVTFDVESGFRGLHGDEFGYEDFVASVRAFLAEGIEPMAKLERAPRDLPQDPNDPAFHARRIVLTDDPIDRRMVMDVDRRHLEIPDVQPPDAILRVLGLAVEIRVGDGITELVADEDERDEVAFEGAVIAVNLEDGSFTLRDETVVRVGDDTRMKIGDDPIESLEPIARALEADMPVFAWGEGVLADADRHVINAVVVEFAIDDDDKQEEVVFEGVVREIDPEEGAVFLVEGPTVLITDDTRLKIGDESVESLERVLQALEDGLTVIVRGEGIVQSNEPRVIVALVIRFGFEDDDGSDVVAFEGNVESVDLENGKFTLSDGTLVVMTDGTDIASGGNIETLAGVAEALANQLTVRAVGEGAVESDGEQRVLVARWVRFTASD